jgi:nitrile hydratase
MTTRFAVGDRVRVRKAFPPGHLRTPYFIRGKEGVVTAVIGDYANPEELAYGRPGLPKRTLYWVQFAQAALWPDYDGGDDTTVVDIYEHWLEPPEAAAP